RPMPLRLSFSSAAVVSAVLIAGHVVSSSRTAAESVADTVRLAVDGTSSAGTSVATSGRDLVVTWAATAPGPANISAALSRDEGRSFGPARRVNDVDGDARVSAEQGPRASVGQAIEVVWSSRAGTSALVRAARSASGALSFAPAHSVHAEGLSGARGWASVA